MRILILGAGGVGGFYGARLLAAGREVTFLVRAETAARLTSKGLELLSPHGNLKLSPPATVLAGELRGVWDLILLSCKAYDLESSMEAIAPAVGPETSILPLLNGMAHLHVLDARFGRARVLGGATNVSAARDSEGRILHLNELDHLHFGDRDDPAGRRIQEVARALDGANFHASLAPSILGAMWHKWLAIASIAGMTCLMRASVGDFVAAGATPLYLALLEETTSVATAAGYPPSEEYRALVIAKFTDPESLFSTSMLRDVEAGNPVESHQIIGSMLDLARGYGLATPLLELAGANLRCYEIRRARESAD